MQTRSNQSSGFTLIELLIVITIIAILSVIGFSTFSTVQKSGRDSKRVQDLAEIQKAIGQYQLRHGFYEDKGNTGVEVSTLSLSGYFQNGSPPTDPNFEATNYEYTYFSCGKTKFVLCSKFENPTGKYNRSSSNNSTDKCNATVDAGTDLYCYSSN